MKKLKLDTKSFKKILFTAIGAFIIIFLLRWGYSVVFSGNDLTISYNPTYAYNNDTYASAEFEEKSYRSVSGNVASGKIMQKDISTGKDVLIDHKYEKTADLSASSKTFKSDIDSLNLSIENNAAVIQTENLTGLEGFQQLSMTIGVMPDNFDTLVEEIKSIGELESFQVTKTDQTNLFRNLMAEQETLNNTKKSFLEIKAKATDIKDLLLLEEKILEIEDKLKILGVDLGVFDSENSFCTIKFSLRETAAKQISVRFVLTQAKESFFWTLAAFALALFCILVLLTFITIFIVIIRYLQRSPAAEPVNTQAISDNDDSNENADKPNADK